MRKKCPAGRVLIFISDSERDWADFFVAADCIPVRKEQTNQIRRANPLVLASGRFPLKGDRGFKDEIRALWRACGVFTRVYANGNIFSQHHFRPAERAPSGEGLIPEPPSPDREGARNRAGVDSHDAPLARLRDLQSA